jgi:prepilin-type N-terminal cleavage/methylation domain-containing protein
MKKHGRPALPTGRQGFSLVELVIGLMIMSLAFYTLIAVLMLAAPKTAKVENINKKIYLASEKMEEYTARSFSQAVSGETSGSFPGNFAAYNYKVIVTYVTSRDVNTTTREVTYYKKVRALVWGGNLDAARTVEVVTLMTSYEIY